MTLVVPTLHTVSLVMSVLSSLLRLALVFACLLGAAGGALLEDAEARERRARHTERPVCVAVERTGRVRSRAPLLSGFRYAAAIVQRTFRLRARSAPIVAPSGTVQRGDAKPAGFNVAWFVWRRVSAEPAACC